MRLHSAALAASLALVATWSLAAKAAPNGAIAASATEIRPILLGTPAPEVTVETIEGEEIDLAAAVTSKRTVLIFYRGGW